MPSYISYKNNLKAILDADDTEIESWITVRGNHIPIMKGQSKEEAVKSFVESKGGKSKTKESSKKDFYSAGMELAKSLNIDKGRMKDYLEYQKNNSLVKSNTPQDAIKALKNYIKEVNSGNIDDDWELFEDKDPKQVLSELNKIEKESKPESSKKEELKEIKAGREQKGWVESPKFEKLTKKYMPTRGESDNELGEALRSINQIAYRFYNDGDMWNKGYGKETVNWAVKHLTELAKNKNTPKHIARGIDNGLFEMKKYGIKDKDRYETAVKILVQTIEFANESDIDALSKIKNLDSKKD